MLLPTGVKYQPTPSARSETPAALPKLVTRMPTWPGSTRLHEVSGTSATSGISASGDRRRRRRRMSAARSWSKSKSVIVPTPQEKVEFTGEAGGGEESSRERDDRHQGGGRIGGVPVEVEERRHDVKETGDRKSTRLNSSHSSISYAVFCLK